MNKQRGFSIVMAIFILVVLALLSGYMVKLTAVQMATANYTLQGARAYQAARAGIEWSVARLAAAGTCSDITAASPMTFSNMDGFSVTLSCSSQSYSEGLSNPTVYKITAFSEYGSYSSAEYVSRKLEVSIVI